MSPWAASLPPGRTASCVPSTQRLRIDGTPASLKAYNMDGSNFFRLRDLGAFLGFGVGYDEAAAAMLVTTRYTDLRLGSSGCYISLPLGYAAREAGGYALPGANLGFDVYEETGFPDFRSFAAACAAGADTKEAAANGVAAVSWLDAGGDWIVALDAGGGKFEKLVFHLAEAEDAGGIAAKRIVRSLKKMLVIRLGDSPLTVAAPGAFTEAEATDAAGGQAAAYEDAAQGQYFDVYLYGYDSGLDSLAAERAASYNGKAGGVVTWTPMVKYFTVGGLGESGGRYGCDRCLCALIDLGGGEAAELRFWLSEGDADWAMEIVRSLRAG